MPELLVNDTEILNRLKAGDKEAFTYLYQLHSQPLYLNLLKLLKLQPVAEEVLQDVFLTLWEKREIISIDKCLKSYLYRIAENKVYDFFRKLKRDKKLHDSIKEIASSGYGEIEDKLLQKEEVALLNRAIEHLPPQRKMVFRLCKIEGKSYEEISRQLGISTSTINDHIVKATRSVREFILANDKLAATSLTIFMVLYS